MLLSAGMILQAVEALYLPPLIIPGVKLGLANSITLVILIYFDWKDVFSHVLLRVTAVSLLTGTFLSATFFYSLTGGITSATLMIAAYRYLRGHLSFAGISLIGALTHNLAQLSLALVVLGHVAVIAFLPWLLVMAVVAGVPNGVLVNAIAPRLTGLAGTGGRGLRVK